MKHVHDTSCPSVRSVTRYLVQSLLLGCRGIGVILSLPQDVVMCTVTAMKLHTTRFGSSVILFPMPLRCTLSK